MRNHEIGPFFRTNEFDPRDSHDDGILLKVLSGGFTQIETNLSGKLVERTANARSPCY